MTYCVKMVLCNKLCNAVGALLHYIYRAANGQ
jgi:hypothetical protein